MSKFCFCLGLLLFTAIVAVVNAEPSLTVNELTQIAIENNNDLKAAQYNIKLAKARLVQAGLWSNPSINLANTDDRLFTNEGEYTRSAGFSQAFPISGRIGRQKNVARVDVAIAISEVNNAKRLLRGAVADSYYAILITDYRLKQQNKLLAINKKLVRVTQNRFHAAEVSELDTNTASLEYQRILQDKEILDSLRINQIAQLNQLLGRDALSPLPLEKSLPDIKLLTANFNETQELAVKQRPDMHILWLNLNRAQADQQLARSGRWADWTLGLAVQQSKTFVQGGLPQNPDRALSVNLAIPLPILNANQGKIREAGVTGTQALAKMQALRLTIRTEVASNYRQLVLLQKALQQSRLGTLKLRSRNVNLARNAYKNGQISLLEVLQIQRQQNDLQVAYLNMLEKYLQALVKLCTALGNDSTTSLCPYLSDRGNLHAFAKPTK
ncbi:Cation efflux system protein CzcC [Legionella massiliensis]|uniref:Cation efflux system protein CzcC n=1 Tax=Legionella massiliensis TaxID=1034943 RepID=A0A078KUQ8_9GAMM|nr:TolC family protein [Legionella massiliensis]CDZ76737.1 Cation efflux system protein CzcC [Legionella massiliensis]CEE12475.1 Cobalt-zinc-cadmium resistance protein CzcC precursor [Legionella massiliensis]